jgi:hypothetical protein
MATRTAEENFQSLVKRAKVLKASVETDAPQVHVDLLMTAEEWNQLVRALRQNVQISHYATRLWMDGKLVPYAELPAD